MNNQNKRSSLISDLMRRGERWQFQGDRPEHGGYQQLLNKQTNKSKRRLHIQRPRGPEGGRALSCAMLHWEGHTQSTAEGRLASQNLSGRTVGGWPQESRGDDMGGEWT